MIRVSWQKLKLAVGLLIISPLLLTPFTDTCAQQPDGLTPPRAEVKAVVGGSSFGEEIPHGVFGGSVRIYLAPHVGFEPEVLYMRHSRNDQDYLIQPNLTIDLTRPNGRFVPYLIGGVGVIHHRARFTGVDFNGVVRDFDTSYTWWTASAGGGVKIFLTDRFFISPEARVGREPSVRGTINVGYVFSGRK